MNLHSDKIICIGLFSENEFFLAGLESIVSEIENCKVVFATGNENALSSAIVTSTPNICILDLNLHLEKTKNLFASLKESNNNLKIIVLSKADHPYNIFRAFHLGAQGHLSKSADSKIIHRAIVSVFYTGSFYNENVLSEAPEASKKEKQIITDQELAMLNLFCTEMSLKEIARETNLSVAIVEGYKQILSEKLKANSRESLIVTAYKIGLISGADL
ncbi:MAG TPA: response regulator transcription factor [Flavipsychrobacter sp.]|nr:response regulator transcription factor [Flavipsychrobacter sp.]